MKQSSSKNNVDHNNVNKNKTNLIPSFEEFVNKRDYVGILTLIEVSFFFLKDLFVAYDDVYDIDMISVMLDRIKTI